MDKRRSATALRDPVANPQVARSPASATLKLTMQYPELRNKRQDFVGTTGLIYFGQSLVLSYTRDHNTNSYPGHRDLAGGGREGPKETPFCTFARELDEEFDLGINIDQIVYAKQYPGLVEPQKVGYFVVGCLDESEIDNIRFGDEGLTYHVSTVGELLANPLLIPRRKLQVELFLAQAAMAKAV